MKDLFKEGRKCIPPYALSWLARVFSNNDPIVQSLLTLVPGYQLFSKWVRLRHHPGSTSECCMQTFGDKLACEQALGEEDGRGGMNTLNTQ